MVTQNCSDLGAQVVTSKIEQDITESLKLSFSNFVTPNLKKGAAIYSFETNLMPEMVKANIQTSFNETKNYYQKLCIKRTTPEMKIKLPRDEFSFCGSTIITKVKEDCFSSSYLSCKNILAKNAGVNVHILKITPPKKQFLSINSTRAKNNWEYHIVCLVETLSIPLQAPLKQDESRHALIVVDPLLFDTPVTLYEWSNIILNGNNIEVEISSLGEWNAMEKLLYTCN